MEQNEVKKYTTFKIGGEAKGLYFPSATDELKEMLIDMPKALVLGNGSNVLISSSGIDNDIIFTTCLDKLEISGTRVCVSCGVKGQAMAKETQKESLTGFEFMIGIPGTIGGMIFMNAGAHNQQISDNFVSCEVFDYSSKKVITLNKEQMMFDYRKSILKNGKYIVLSAEFELSKANQKNIDDIITRNIEFRKNHQPSLAMPNAGSVFKNPIGDSAGRLLDLAGVKSIKVGDAEVYEKHANFIINKGNATSVDVSQLMFNMYSMVKNKYHIRLQPEIRYFGRKTKEEEKIWQELLHS